MKKITAIILTALCFSNSNAQKLTLTDLTTLCSKKNWEDVNQVLLAKGWDYHESSSDFDKEYKKTRASIIWSFNKNSDNDKAQGWLTLTTYDEQPQRMFYEIANKESYLPILNSLTSAGFKLTKTEIDNNRTYSDYENATYNVRITAYSKNIFTEKKETGYYILVVKTGSCADYNNGKKITYRDDGTIYKEYTLHNGEKTGLSKSYHKNEQLYSMGNYVSGKETGLWKYYHENEQLHSMGNYVSGKEAGLWKYYHENGQLHEIGNYTNGNATGLWKRYYENGALESECPNGSYYWKEDCKNYYENGQIKEIYDNDGNVKEYDEKGNLTEERDYGSNITKRYENGKISEIISMREYEYKDDKFWTEEMVEKFHYDTLTGKLIEKEIGKVADDKKEGEWNKFRIEDNKEHLIATETYKEGEKNGAFESRDPLNNVVVKGKYLNGKKDGEWIVNNSNNKLMRKEFWDGNRLSTLINFDSLSGIITDKYEISGQRHCKRTLYFDEFEKESQDFSFSVDIGNYLLSSIINRNSYDKTLCYPNGWFKSFNSNNQPIITGNYKEEEKVGIWTFYYYDQNVKIESEFVQNNRMYEKYFNLNDEPFSGEFVYNDEENEIKEIRKIKDGLRNGNTVYIDTKTKKTIKKEKYKNGKLK